MGIIYPDVDPPWTGPFINPAKLDPVKQYVKHYENWKYLQFIHDNTRDGAEKRQANLEMGKATAKMDRWFKMSHMDRARLETEKRKVDVQWRRSEE